MGDHSAGTDPVFGVSGVRAVVRPRVCVGETRDASVVQTGLWIGFGHTADVEVKVCLVLGGATAVGRRRLIPVFDALADLSVYLASGGLV